MFRKVCIFICLFLTFFIQACDENTQSSSEGVLSPISLSLYSEDLNLYDQGFSNPIAKAITSETGVSLNILYPTEGVSEKIDLMITSGDYPDMIMIKDTQKLVDAGAYMDLRPLIEKYGPNLKKLYGDYYNRLKFSLEDESIYVLPTKPVDEVRLEPIMGFQLQHAVVRALNYPKLETMQDYENAIKRYMTMYPRINGEVTIGITMVIDDWRWLISLGNFSAFATGLPDDGNWYIDPETYEATYRFLRPEEKEYFRWINHIYHEGLIDPDSFVQDFDAYTAKIASGRVLGLIDAKWQYSYGESLLKASGKEDRMYGQYPIQMDETTKAADFRDIGYMAGYGIGLSKDCEDPVAAIKFLDFMASDQGHILRFWGIEGENYYYEDGERKLYDDQLSERITDPEYFKRTGINTYAYPFPMWGLGKKDSTDNYYNPESLLLQRDQSEIEKNILKQYGATKWSDLYPSSEELPKSLWGQAWDIPIPSEGDLRFQLEACDEIIKKGIVKAILSKPEGFDDHWAMIINDLEAAGVHEMGQIFTKLILDRINLWQ
jgi:putative aldouronate transport system substrate-binding protein